MNDRSDFPSSWLRRLGRRLPLSLRLILMRAWQSHLGLRRKRPYALDYGYQSSLIRNLPKDGRILDLSSGATPFPPATILSDLTLGTSPHRSGSTVHDHRPFVLLDAQRLPFKDRSIDYIYCSHVLEHLPDPEAACREIMRVGKAGYIETPTQMKDALFGWAADTGHRWHVTTIGNRLVFFEYDERQRAGVRSPRWREDILGEFHHPYQDLFFLNQDLFNAHLEWTGGFEVSVFHLRNRDIHP